MVATDPRATLKGYFNDGDTTCHVTAANLTLEDGSNAKFESQYEYPNMNLHNLFLAPHNVDIEFLIRDLGVDPPVYGASGPVYRVYRVGIQPVIIDKWTSGGTLSLDATKLLFKAQNEIYTVLDAYYTGDDKIVGRTLPATFNPGREGLIYGPTVESLTKIYMFSATTGTESIQRWTSIKIGYDATHYTETTDGILDFNYSRTHPASRENVAATVSADDLVQHHSNFIFQIIMDGDKNSAFFTQEVFHGILTNITGVATGSPITLDPDGHTVNVTTLGTFKITLPIGATGTAASGTCTVNGSPVALTAGDNTITTSVGIGTITITVTGGGTAMDDDGDSNKIKYFLVTAAMRGPTGTAVTRTYTVSNGYILANSYEGNNRFIYTGDAETITAVDV